MFEDFTGLFGVLGSHDIINRCHTLTFAYWQIRDDQENEKSRLLVNC
jgi:hypothetical protein